MFKKKEGFSGQVNIVLPNSIIEKVQKNQLINDLFVTDIGYYPSAKYHFRKRAKGIDQCILFYVVEGSGWIEVDKLKHKLVKNSFFIIPANSPHQYSSDAQNPWSIYWMHFKGEKANKFSRIFNKKFSLDNAQFTKVDERIHLFNEIISNLSEGFNMESLEYSNLCLHHLLATFCYLNQFNHERYVKDIDVVQKSLNFMNSNLNRNISLKVLAQQVELSSSHFSRIFKLRMNYSPSDYFTHLKMQHACQLLDVSNLRISEISLELGYLDQFYFSRVFKKAIGVSPRVYREKK